MPIRLNQEKFEDMIDHSIRLTTPKQLEARHYPDDLLRRTGQE